MGSHSICAGHHDHSLWITPPESWRRARQNDYGFSGAARQTAVPGSPWAGHSRQRGTGKGKGGNGEAVGGGEASGEGERGTHIENGEEKKLYEVERIHRTQKAIRGSQHSSATVSLAHIDAVSPDGAGGVVRRLLLL